MELQRLDYPPQVERARQRFGIVGNSPALMESIARAVQVAPIDLSVLVTGESGTGKEFFPKIIHEFSPRKHSRYIAVNCGAILRKPTAALYFSTRWPSSLSPPRRAC